MKRIVILGLILLTASLSLYSNTDRNFDKMIGYFLLNDIKLSKAEFKKFFNKNTEMQLKKSYSLLLNGKKGEAFEEFLNYLEMRPKSIEGLIGFALSETGKVKATILNLQKAVRLDSSSSIALLCIGNEYLNEQNYPKSESYFTLACNANDSFEFKIVRAYLYLKMQKPNKIIELLKDEFDSHQTNFYINYLLASAYYMKNKLNNMLKHLDLLNGEGENKKKGNLLIAKYYIKKRNFKKAKSILFQLKYKDDNEDYNTALAITMMNLNSSKSLYFLYKAFKTNLWNKQINKQLGIYYYKRGKKMMVQNFIYRSLLSGIPAKKLKEYFSGINFDIPEYKSFNFFHLYDAKWMNNNLIAVFAKQYSGQKCMIYIIDTKKNRIIKTFQLPFSEKGIFHKAFGSKTGKIVFSFFNPVNNIMSVYGLSKQNRGSYKLDKILSLPAYIHERVYEPSLLVSFDKSGSNAYITDGGIERVAFNSPFLVKYSLMTTKPAYPKYPFDIIKYNFTTGESYKILNMNQMKSIQIKAVQKYFLINQAYIGNKKVRDMILSGEKMDIISEKKVFIFFEEDLSSFLIYLKSSEYSMDAILFKNDNSSFSFNETSFLGKKIMNETIPIKLFKLDSKKNNLIVMRKDTNQLINYNYSTKLYSYLNKNVSKLYYYKSEDVYYSIENKDNTGSSGNTLTTMFTTNPYIKLNEFKRDNIREIDVRDRDYDTVFYTRNEARLRLNEKGKFEYIGPSFRGVIHSTSMDKNREAAYINGRLIIINKTKKRKKAKKDA